MNAFELQYLSGMAAQAIFIGWFDPRMRLVTLVAVQARHGDLLRENIFAGLAMAGEAGNSGSSLAA